MAKILTIREIGGPVVTGANYNRNQQPNKTRVDQPASELGQGFASLERKPLSDEWERKFAEILKQEAEARATARASSPKPKFNHWAWRHRSLGEPKELGTISKKAVDDE